MRVVLVTGAGKDFCSGMDLRTFADDASGDLAKFQAEARNMAGLLLDMRRHPRPIVAAVQGRALGGGCGIATAADIVLAADSAQFGYPEINIGFVPAIVMAILRRLVSEKRAFELIATAKSFPPDGARIRNDQSRFRRRNIRTRGGRVRDATWLPSPPRH